MAPHKILEKKNFDFSSSFAKLLLFKSIGPPSNFKISSKRHFTKKIKIQASRPFIAHSQSKFIQTTTKIFNKSQISNIIHQKEKSFVNQVSQKFKNQSFRAISGCTTQTHIFRLKCKIPKVWIGECVLKNTNTSTTQI